MGASKKRSARSGDNRVQKMGIPFLLNEHQKKSSNNSSNNTSHARQQPHQLAPQNAVLSLPLSTLLMLRPLSYDHHSPGPDTSAFSLSPFISPSYGYTTASFSNLPAIVPSPSATTRSAGIPGHLHPRQPQHLSRIPAGAAPVPSSMIVTNNNPYPHQNRLYLPTSSATSPSSPLPVISINVPPPLPPSSSPLGPSSGFAYGAAPFAVSPLGAPLSQDIASSGAVSDPKEDRKRRLQQAVEDLNNGVFKNIHSAASAYDVNYNSLKNAVYKINGKDENSQRLSTLEREKRIKRAIDGFHDGRYANLTEASKAEKVCAETVRNRYHGRTQSFSEAKKALK